MSIIFGIKKSDGGLVDEHELLALAHTSARWALDGMFTRTHGRMGMGFQPYYTHVRSNLESHPVLDEIGNMVTLDGRLDNHKELCDLFEIDDSSSSDASIVLAAYRRWGEGCFSRLVGDWALAIWSQSNETLYLARDHVGSRTLYYSIGKDDISWATFLEPVVARSGDHSLDQLYASRYIACAPIADRTPYKNVRSVPPAHYVKVFGHNCQMQRHWDATLADSIHYGDEDDYAEQFLRLFRQSVQRRLDGGEVVVAELSGGLDSTSIVCMADSIRQRAGEQSQRILDTVSYYNDAEGSWNEGPYVEITEAGRGKTGYHIHLPECLSTFQTSAPVYPLPGATETTLPREHKVLELLGADQYRVVLSGIGGDEVLGGIPVIAIELAIKLLDREFGKFFSSALAWSLSSRLPLVQILPDVFQSVANSSRNHVQGTEITPTWIRSHVCTRSLEGMQPSSRGWPSSTEIRRVNNDFALLSVTESMPHTKHPYLVRREFRYPYLDRNLLEFLLNIPHDQLARPGRRRYLMRRALRSLVPAEILERRRKAFLIRTPLLSLQRASADIERRFKSSRIVDLGIVDATPFLKALSDVVSGRNLELWPYITRTVEIDLWLRNNTLL